MFPAWCAEDEVGLVKLIFAFVVVAVKRNEFGLVRHDQRHRMGGRC